MLRRLVFTHIPKTGGSSIWRLLSQIAEAKNLSLLSIGGASSVLASADLSDRMFAARGLQIRDYQIITGHVPFATAARYFMPGGVFVTVLRDPRWQLISNYCSQPENKEKHDFGMSEFITQIRSNRDAEWALDNNQTRMLANRFRFGLPTTPAMLDEAKANLLHHYGVVGTVQHVMRLLIQLYAAPIDKAPHTNATGSYENHVREEHLAFAAEVNAFDMQLYGWALEQRMLAKPPRTDEVTPPYPNRVSGVRTTLASKIRKAYRTLRTKSGSS